MNYIPKGGFPYYFEFEKNIDCKSLFSSLSTITFLNSISEEKAVYRLAPNKWSIKTLQTTKE